MPKDETRVFLHTRDNQPAQRSTLLYLVYAAHTTVRLFSPPLNCVFKALRYVGASVLLYRRSLEIAGERRCLNAVVCCTAVSTLNA